VKIVWAPRALERVAEQAAHIARDRPGTADRWVEGLFNAVDRLACFPSSARQVDEVGRADIREIVYSGCRVIVRVEPDRVVVLTVRHQRQRTAPDDLQVDL
jgi:toxin ParE1/3/4